MPSGDGPGVVLTPKEIDVSGMVVATASANANMANNAPAGVGTANPSAWLEVINQGTKYYIPMWT